MLAHHQRHQATFKMGYSDNLVIANGHMIILKGLDRYVCINTHFIILMKGLQSLIKILTKKVKRWSATIPHC